MLNKRSAGILLPISSLDSNYGIGTLGKKAYEFIDFLKKANQTYWQVLPIGHTSYGDSPYQPFSSFAGNPYFIDLDLLVEDKLLEIDDLKHLKNDKDIDYGYLYETRYEVLYKAYTNGKKRYEKEINEFLNNNHNWIYDYSLFMAIKKHFNMVSWLEWPIELRKRDPLVLEKYLELLNDDVRFYQFIQFLFYRQYENFINYAHSNGIKIIGDLPIYVSLDSSDVWADPKQFQLDEDLKPTFVAGVPPDYFSKTGQLWGNPLYDWDYMKTTGYKWWIQRIASTAKYFDVIRIDHFRGFEEYWAVPYGDTIAKNGHWVNGPSLDFVSTIRDWFADVEFIAEDLGIISENVTILLNQSGFPGMRVLQFSMADDGTSYHSPHHHINNCVCYISTHDNTPIMGWVKNAKKKDLDYAKLYYGLNEEEGFNYGFIRAGMSSVANLFICQMQDYLGLDDSATINNPGTLGNWRWRIDSRALTDKLANKIAKFTHSFNRDRINK